ncbi:MAG TPA: hypothetical protein VFT27_01905 [Actinomycetota bacterium]|nr:hypothetical protein [Actinomycetota bacterium]
MLCLRTYVVVLAIGLAACTSGIRGPSPSSTLDPPSTQVATPTPPSTSPTPSTLAFESERHRYRLRVPSDWQVVQYEGEWTTFDQFGPGAEVPGEDVIAPPDLSSFLVVNSMTIPTGMSSAEWLARFDARVTSSLDPDCPDTRGKAHLGGERATVIEQPCGGSIIVGQSLTHARRGYYFTIRFPEGDQAAEATLDAIVASIRFIGR